MRIVAYAMQHHLSIDLASLTQLCETQWGFHQGQVASLSSSKYPGV